jgi:hypothetical protein
MTAISTSSGRATKVSCGKVSALEPRCRLVFTRRTTQKREEKHATVGAHYAVPMIGYGTLSFPRSRVVIFHGSISDDRVHRMSRVTQS